MPCNNHVLSRPIRAHVALLFRHQLNFCRRILCVMVVLSLRAFERFGVFLRNGHSVASARDRPLICVHVSTIACLCHRSWKLASMLKLLYATLVITSVCFQSKK